MYYRPGTGFAASQPGRAIRLEHPFPSKGTIFSVGHSTRSIEDFIALLKKNRVELVADVRRFPSSKKYPWFCRESLEKSLKESGIGYAWLGEGLGGFRKGGYEAYMETGEFREGIAKLETMAATQPVAFMCAEASEARCHRKYIARNLEKVGWKVVRI